MLVKEGNGNPLQYSCLENPMGRGVWWAAVHGVIKSQIRLTNFTFTFHFHALKKEMATHSSVLAWRIPGMAELDGLPSVELHRVGHDWHDLAAAAAAHASKVMLKILQARLQQYVNCEIPDVQAGFRRQKNQRSNCQYLQDHQKSKRVPEKHLFLLYWLCQSLWLCGSR